MTACAFRYPRSEPRQRFAILDLTEPQFRLLIDAADRGLEFGDFDDHDAAAELTAILQQAREALGQ